MSYAQQQLSDTVAKKRTHFCCCQELPLITRALHLAGSIRGYSLIDHRCGSTAGRWEWANEELICSKREPGRLKLP